MHARARDWGDRTHYDICEVSVPFASFGVDAQIVVEGMEITKKKSEMMMID